MKYLLIVLIVVISQTLSGQQIKWIQADDSSVEDILSIADNKERVTCFFMHADWSRQSRHMEDVFFHDHDVNKYYSQHFINAKINVGEGKSNRIITNYKISSLPALVFVDTDGNVLKVASNKGLFSGRAILKVARLAMKEPGEMDWSYYRDQYRGGQRDWQFLEYYIDERMLETGLPTPYHIIEEYIYDVPEEGRMQNARVRNYILAYANPSNELYTIMRQEQAKIQELHNVVMSIDIFGRMLNEAQRSRYMRVDNIKRQLQSDFGELSYPALEYYEIVNALNTSKSNAYVDEYFEFIKKYHLQPTYYECILPLVLSNEPVNQEYLNLLLEYFKDSVRSFNNDIFDNAIITGLLLKSGNVEDAMLFAQTAINKVDLLPLNKIEEKCIVYMQKVANGHSNISIYPILEDVF